MFPVVRTLVLPFATLGSDLPAVWSTVLLGLAIFAPRPPLCTQGNKQITTAGDSKKIVHTGRKRATGTYGTTLKCRYSSGIPR